MKKVTRRTSSGQHSVSDDESDRQIALLSANNKSMLVKNQSTDFDHQRWLFESKGRYGIGNACWQDDDKIWFAFSWLLDQLPKLNPINRATDLVALKDKFESKSRSNPTGRSDLPGVDVFISTADPDKEPPLVTANTILSILAVEYPIEKVALYISDDGGAILTFEAMAEAVNFSHVSEISSVNSL
ncbi:cellulose synthase-like protein D1 [Tanacetum coccineum]